MSEQQTVTIGAWWAPCCIEDLCRVESEADLAEAWLWLNDDIPSMARTWATLADALAEPDIARQVAARDYSPKTAARLGLPLGA